ncbi:hypothetical protein D9M71_508910 [compost metagenome]
MGRPFTCSTTALIMPMASVAANSAGKVAGNGHAAAKASSAATTNSTGQARRRNPRARSTPSALPATKPSTAPLRRSTRARSASLMATARRVVLPLMNDTKSPSASKPMASVMPASTDRAATRPRPTRPRITCRRKRLAVRAGRALGSMCRPQGNRFSRARVPLMVRSTTSTSTMVWWSTSMLSSSPVW